VLAGLTLISTVGVAVGAQPAFAATTYYVDATNGSDSYDGLSPTRGSDDVGAFQTIQKCANEAGPGDVCSIRGGTYRERVVPNSGTDGAPVTFRAHNDEPVTVSGLNRVTSPWTQHNGSNIYRTTVTLPINGYADSGFLANQVFVEGAPMLEARWPNSGTDLLRPNRAVAKDGTDTDTIVDAAIPQIPGGWTGGRVYVRLAGKYTSASATIDSSTVAGGTTTLQLNGSTLITGGPKCPQSCIGKESLYFLYGKLAALDTANEWFYDGTTLYAWAPGGAVPRGIEYKARTEAFDLDGKSHVHVVGLRLKAANVSTDASSTGNVLDRLDASHVSHFMTVPFDASRPFGGLYDDAHMRDTGIILNGTNNTLKNSVVAYSAGNGVSLDGSGHVVDNNVIHDVNYGGTYSAGVVPMGGSTQLTISRNTIYNTGRDGISMAVNLGAGSQTWMDNDVSYNEIFDVGLLNADLGVIYICCSIDLTGTRFHHNLIRTGGVNGIMGIYLDGGSGQATIDHNILTDTAGVTMNRTNAEQGGGVNRGDTAIYNNHLGSIWSNHSGAGDVRNNVFTHYTPTDGTATGSTTPNVGSSQDARIENLLNFDFRLRTTGTPPSAAINTGVVIPGITDGYVGSAPDQGPYEVGENWRAGATFFIASENVARTAVVTASSSSQGAGAAVTDGNQYTRWNAASGQSTNQWLQFDFGTPLPVNEVRVAETGEGITSWAVQQWNGSAWVDVATGTLIRTFRQQPIKIGFPEVTTSRIRLLMNGTAAPSINEMAVYRTERFTNPLLNVTATGQPRNNASQKLGQKFTTKGSPIEVTELGRYWLPGNSRSHTLELVRVADDTTVASATLDLATVRPRRDGFAYAQLAAPVVLAPYTSYYLVTTETANGDDFHDAVDTSATAGDLITLDGAVNRTNNSWNELPGDGGYGPVTLTYQPFQAKDARPGLTVTTLGVERNNYTGRHGAKITVGGQPYTISQLGRWKGTGTGVHTLSVIRVSDGAPVASARLDLSAATAPAENGIAYVPLTRPVTLTANTSYYLVSTETNGGDPFRDVWGTNATSDRVTVDSGVYSSGSSWITPNRAGALYGPVSMR